MAYDALACYSVWGELSKEGASDYEICSKYVGR